MKESLKRFDLYTIPTVLSKQIKRPNETDYTLWATQTFGFDFIRRYDGEIICVEINGSNSGIKGFLHISDDKKTDFYLTLIGKNPLLLKASERTYVAKTPDLREELSLKEEIFNQLKLLYFYLTDPNFVKRKWLINNHNDLEVFYALYNKRLARGLIPEEHRTKLITKSAQLKERASYLVKPIFGSRGNDILIVSPKEARAYLGLFSNKGYLVERLERAMPADLTKGTDYSKNKASMRMLVEFEFWVSLKESRHKIVTNFVLPYQRVSEIKASTLLQPYECIHKDAYIVNLSNGNTIAFPASKKEALDAWVVAQKIALNAAHKYCPKGRWSFVKPV